MSPAGCPELLHMDAESPAARKNKFSAHNDCLHHISRYPSVNSHGAKPRVMCERATQGPE